MTQGFTARVLKSDDMCLNPDSKELNNTGHVPSGLQPQPAHL